MRYQTWCNECKSGPQCPRCENRDLMLDEAYEREVSQVTYIGRVLDRLMPKEGCCG